MPRLGGQPNISHACFRTCSPHSQEVSSDLLSRCWAVAFSQCRCCPFRIGSRETAPRRAKLSLSGKSGEANGIAPRQQRNGKLQHTRDLKERIVRHLVEPDGKQLLHQFS